MTTKAFPYFQTKDLWKGSFVMLVYFVFILRPLEDLQKFGVKETDILALKQSDNIQKLLAFEAKKAQALYDKARRILPREDFKTLLTARTMGAIYEQILFKFIQKSCTLQEKKIKLSKVVKLLVLFRTWSEK